MKVLVIDDSDVARALLRETLEKVGAQVFEQPSAIGATRNIIQNEIHVAVIDVTMPGLSGDRLVEVLRSNPRLEGLVIVLVSGKSFDELQAIEKSSSADAVLSKEEVPNRLGKLVASLYTQAAMMRSLNTGVIGRDRNR